MDWVDGSSLEQLPAGQITDDLLVRLWAEVDKLHRAGIAHRSLRAANVMVNPAGWPMIVDFSFSELAATQRQMDLDVAELLASLATLVGEERAVSTAAKVLGAEGVAPAVPLLQPLALSAGTRRAVTRQPGLLTRTRSQAADASGQASAGTGPRGAGAAADPADHRRAVRRVLLPAAPAGQGRQPLASAGVGPLGLGPGGHRLLGADLPGQRHRAARRRLGPGAVLAHGPVPGRLLVRQPGVAVQRGRHGAERALPAESRR